MRSSSETLDDTKSINELFYLNSEKKNWFWSLFNGIGMIISYYNFLSLISLMIFHS